MMTRIPPPAAAGSFVQGSGESSCRRRPHAEARAGRLDAPRRQGGDSDAPDPVGVEDGGVRDRSPSADRDPRAAAVPAIRSPREAYRPDIDGLRAVAVTLVVLFHYGLAAVPGGFVGVDVFFVISGYLITSISRAELDRGRFSLFAFYERRIRRIVPALAMMLVATGLASLFVVLPEDLRVFAKSMLASTVFASNALFARLAADYFAADTLTLEPLLHTWSLAVEAQFYLLYPLVLLLARRRRAAIPAAIAVLAGLSFALGAWGAMHRPVATFYLLPGRAWELLLGGLLTFAPAIGRRVLADLSVAGGVAAILAAAVTYDPATPFPGVAALLPCCGAALVIHGGGGRLSAWLGARPLVGLGRISYSLYLWHWPVLVLARYGRGPDLPPMAWLSLLAGTLVLSALSYALIERPVIGRRLLARRRTLLAGAGAATVAVLVLGQTLDLAGRGVLPLVRLPPEVLRLANGSFDRLEGECPVPDADALPYPCRFGAEGPAPTLALWGNSYARMWIPALAGDAVRHGTAGLAFIFSKCPPLLGRDPPDLPGCASFNRDTLAYIERHPSIRTVVLGADWFADGPGLSGLDATLAALKAAGVAVAVLLAPPQADYSVPRTLAIAALRGRPPPPPIDEAEARARQRPSTDVIAGLARRYGFAMIDPATRLCRDGVCPVVRDGHPVFYDAGHVTVSAARAVTGLFDPLFDAAAARSR